MGKVLLLLPFFFLSFSLSAQDTKQNLIEKYFDEAGSSAALYNGKEYRVHPNTYKGHPFLVREQYIKGTLKCDGVIYPDILMRLDWHADELMVQSSDQRFNVVIPAERIQYAVLHEYHLFYHTPDNLPGSPRAGYYLRLYDNRIKVLERETVVIEGTIKDRRWEYTFNRNTRFYVWHNERYNRIGSQRALLNLFPSKKKELKQFAKENKLVYKADPEKFVLAIVQQYETLTQ